jgi:hypothetical protein
MEAQRARRPPVSNPAMKQEHLSVEPTRSSLLVGALVCLGVGLYLVLLIISPG